MIIINSKKSDRYGCQYSGNVIAII